MKIVIVGAGEVGFHIASHLALEKKDVVVVDTDPAAIRRVADNIDVQVVNGSGSSPVTLQAAGIKTAEILLAVTDSDEANLVACLMTDIISPTTKKLARVRDADFDPYHPCFRDKAPHIDMVINPEIEVIKTIERLMSVPGAVDVGEFAAGRVKFLGVRLEPSAGLAGLRLADLPGKGAERGFLIVALVRGEEMIIPSGADRLQAGDLVYFICEENNLSQTLSLFDKREEPIRRVMIVGGGRLGLRLADKLEKTALHTRIVEKRGDRCQDLAARLDRTVVLHGDGSDRRLLLEENIQDMDVVITLTNDEETNILASLLAARMGARKTITRISRFSYFPLMSAIGLEQVISTRWSAINSILQHIRRGKVLSAISIKGEQAEVMEAEALETSDVVDRPIKRLKLPRGVLVIGVIRGDQVIIPSGDTVIRGGDRIIVFAQRAAIARMERIMAVRLEYF